MEDFYYKKSISFSNFEELCTYYYFWGVSRNRTSREYFFKSDTTFFFVYIVNFYFHNFTNFSNRIDIGDAFLDSKFRNMNHSFFSFSKFNNGTNRVENFYNFSLIHITYFDIFENSFDKFKSCFSSLLSFCCNSTLSIVFKIYLYTKILFDSLDGFSSFSDYFTHFFFRNKDSKEKRGVR